MGRISIFGVLRLRATQSAVARDRPVRRSAQDDDFVGVLKKTSQIRLALMGRQSWVDISKSTSPVRDG